MELIDLRSDTVTLPTDEMRKAMAEAKVGDDVYREDPTVIELEQRAAEIMGKEAGLFTVSGTMGNQVAVMTHTHRGDEIILEEQAHIFYYEVGAVAALSGVQARTVRGKHGVMAPEDITAAIRPDDIHAPKTSLICLENTHNRAGGTVVPLQNMEKVYSIAKNKGISVHLDGARIFNAATFLGVKPSIIAQYADSVMFCLSKGLCAPVGSLLVGSKDWIERARKTRKMLGGGMRQAGVLAAAGLIALEKMPGRLQEDHENAHKLAEGLAQIPGIYVDMDCVQTNIVFHDIKATAIDPGEYVERLKRSGILINNTGTTRLRMVTHYGITKCDIEKTLCVIKSIVKGD